LALLLPYAGQRQSGVLHTALVFVYSHSMCCLSCPAGWVLFAFCTFWCCALLMPINGTAGFLVTAMTQQQQQQQQQQQ
jgi:hypothetical protein